MDSIRSISRSGRGLAAGAGARAETESRTMAAPMTAADKRLRYLAVVTAGITMGMGFGLNISLGLFLVPVSDAVAGGGRGAFAMAAALAAVLGGFSSILWGTLSDKHGAPITVATGSLVVCLSFVLTSYATEGWHLWLWLPIEGLASGAYGPGVVLSAVAKLFPDDEERRSKAMGVASSLWSSGAVVIPPAVAALLTAGGGGAEGWRWAMRMIAGGALVMLPLSALLAKIMRKVAAQDAANEESTAELPAVAVAADTDADAEGEARPSGSVTTMDEADTALEPTLAEYIAAAKQHRPFVLLVVGFFTCGFHTTFLSTHLPAYCNDVGLDLWVGAASVSLIGAGNVLGTGACGALISRPTMRAKKHMVLAGIYSGRSVMFALLIIVAAASALSAWFLIGWSFVIGILYLSTVPPTSGLIVDMFGTTYNSTLFGFAFASHQVGAFFGSWLGGAIYDSRGSYDAMWWLMIAFGCTSAVLHLGVLNDKSAILLRHEDWSAAKKKHGQKIEDARP